MVSEWMENGTIMDFVTTYPETNRLKLVSSCPNPELSTDLTRSYSWQMSLVD